MPMLWMLKRKVQIIPTNALLKNVSMGFKYTSFVQIIPTNALLKNNGHLNTRKFKFK